MTKRMYKGSDGLWKHGEVDNSGYDRNNDYIREEDRGPTDEDKAYEQRKAQERSEGARAVIDGINEIGREAWQIGTAPHIRLIKDIGHAFKMSIIPTIVITVIITIISMIWLFFWDNQVMSIFVGLAAFGYFGYKKHKINVYKKNNSYRNRH